MNHALKTIMGVSMFMGVMNAAHAEQAATNNVVSPVYSVTYKFDRVYDKKDDNPVHQHQTFTGQMTGMGKMNGGSETIIPYAHDVHEFKAKNNATTTTFDFKDLNYGWKVTIDRKKESNAYQVDIHDVILESMNDFKSGNQTIQIPVTTKIDYSHVLFCESGKSCQFTFEANGYHYDFQMTPTVLAPNK